MNHISPGDTAFVVLCAAPVAILKVVALVASVQLSHQVQLTRASTRRSTARALTTSSSA